MLTQDRLRSVLDYDPNTGVFVWKVRASIRIVPGKIAGSPMVRGYVCIGVDGMHYTAHRLAWLYVHGRFPDGPLDHINRNKKDNRIANLRECSNSENAHNARMRKNNKSGVHGVSWDKINKKWLAKICVSRRQIYLGLYSSLDDASEARKRAERLLHPARHQSL